MIRLAMLALAATALVGCSLTPVAPECRSPFPSNGVRETGFAQQGFSRQGGSFSQGIVERSRCTTPKYQQVISKSDCRAVQGAPARMTKNGQMAHKYVCNGQGVWAVDL